MRVHEQKNNILTAIGNTDLIQLHNMSPTSYGNVFVKLETQNPTGSMKDRMALGLINKLEEERLIEPGWTIVEYTGGSTGASLALVCQIKGYSIQLVSSRAFSQEKLDQMAALGGKVTLIPYDNKGITRELILGMIEKVKEMSLSPKTYWVNQIENPYTIAGYYSLGEEIWRQTNGKVDAFVHSVGSAASLNGVASILKKYNPKVKIYAVEPSESAVLSGGKSGAHDIEGIAIGRVPSLWNSALVDEVLTVSTVDAKNTARDLACKEGIMAGTSSGGNLYAAMQVAKKLGADSNIVTLAVDTGLKYMSTDLYRNISHMPIN